MIRKLIKVSTESESRVTIIYAQDEVCPICGVYSPDGDVCPNCLKSYDLYEPKTLYFER
jgi:hypothetical protein